MEEKQKTCSKSNLMVILEGNNTCTLAVVEWPGLCDYYSCNIVIIMITLIIIAIQVEELITSMQQLG